MAKGNIGNLLQHFIALRVAQKLVNKWGQPNNPIEYIDCYSMAPCEIIAKGVHRQGFEELINNFPNKTECDDLVAKAFKTAWETCHNNNVPDKALNRRYPNTSVLLRSAFPDQHWNMRLHDIDEEKRKELTNWCARQQEFGNYQVQSNWRNSHLISNCPAPTDKPVMIMVDPYQIRSEQQQITDKIKKGVLPAASLNWLVGEHALSIKKKEKNHQYPLVLILFSYNHASPFDPKNIITKTFGESGWDIEIVQSGPWQVDGCGTKCSHLGWIISKGLECPVLGSTAQKAWEEWTKV